MKNCMPYKKIAQALPDRLRPRTVPAEKTGHDTPRHQAADRPDRKKIRLENG